MSDEIKTRKVEGVMVKGIWAIIGAVIIGIFTGVGSFQMLVAGEVKAQGVELLNLKEALKSDRVLVEARLGNLVNLMEASAKVNSELVSLVREQNRLIERYYLSHQQKN
jgi:uncharacterized protein YqgC (DUF456 family)